ncbi:MAG: hypothetical protein Q9207_003973 [Kuettlingeria erythrocarpa]
MSPKIPIRFLDAGLGTTLESPPYDAKFPKETCLWSSHLLITSPEVLTRVHKAFIEAGADVLLTATYQASLEGFTATTKPPGSHGPDKRASSTYTQQDAAALMRSAVPLARQAIITSSPNNGHYTPKIALSLGSYGATMQPSTEYSGDYKPESMRTVKGLYEWHEERLRVFKDDEVTWNNVDCIAFETLPVLHEIQAVKRLMAMHEDKYEKEWWISCVFPNDDLTMPDGTTAEQAVCAMLSLEEAERPWGVGINCTDIKKLDRLIRHYGNAATKAIDRSSQRGSWPWLVVYPDGAQGSVYNTGTGQWEMIPELKAQGPQIPWHEELAEIVTSTAERGLWRGILVGGCCKTRAEDIKKLRSQLTSVQSDAFYLEMG